MKHPSKACIDFWIQKINDFLKNSGFKIEPLPEVIIDDSKNDPSDLLIKTGWYDCNASRICLRISNRHLKDVLRSYCHELVHHHQNLENIDYFKRVWKGGRLVENPELEQIEAEAYLKGNLNFRKFTEHIQKTQKHSLISNKQDIKINEHDTKQQE